MTSEATQLEKRYLTESQAAQITNFSSNTLKQWRSARKGPPFIKIGKSIRYPESDLIGWMESFRVSTEEGRRRRA
jgi:predicted DNA-binding transcriptional regulator AlpA